MIFHWSLRRIDGPLARMLFRLFFVLGLLQLEFVTILNGVVAKLHGYVIHQAIPFPHSLLRNFTYMELEVMNYVLNWPMRFFFARVFS
jgi:hypothetical protein